MSAITLTQSQGEARGAKHQRYTLLNEDQACFLLALAMCSRKRYGLPVVANSATGFDGLISKRRSSAQDLIASAFFVFAMSCYGDCVWETFGSAGFRLPQSVNLHTAATQYRLTAIRGSSESVNGVVPMPTLNPSALRAYVHRRLALAALRADSSLPTRLARYTRHMNTARTLEAGGAQ